MCLPANANPLTLQRSTLGNPWTARFYAPCEFTRAHVQRYMRCSAAFNDAAGTVRAGLPRLQVGRHATGSADCEEACTRALTPNPRL